MKTSTIPYRSKRIREHINKAKAFGLACIALGDTIKSLGSIPSGKLYTVVMGHMSLDVYNAAIETLKNSGVISEDSQHVLKYEGK